MEFIGPILIFSTCFLALFATAELLYMKAGMAAEFTRKIVHAGTGFLTLGFPIFFYSAWQVIIICSMFLLLLLLSKTTGTLKSINNVNRKTYGSLLYPIIVVIVFLYYDYMLISDDSQKPLLHFYIPVLVMAVADPAAAIAGNWYKKRWRKKNGKTFFGSAWFFATAFLISFTLVLLLSNEYSILAIAAWSLLLASLTSITERVSGNGWDNFTIPLAAIIVLYLMNQVR